MSTIKDEEELCQNLKNLSITLKSVGDMSPTYPTVAVPLYITNSCHSIKNEQIYNAGIPAQQEQYRMNWID